MRTTTHVQKNLQISELFDKIRGGGGADSIQRNKIYILYYSNDRIYTNTGVAVTTSTIIWIPQNKNYLPNEDCDRHFCTTKIYFKNQHRTIGHHK